MKQGKNCWCHCHTPGVTAKHIAACCDGIGLPRRSSAFARPADNVYVVDDNMPCIWCLEDDCRGGCLT